MKSCFFIGHREISEEIFSALTEVYPMSRTF